MVYKDFFISYNQHDREIAEWIGWQLEEAGYTIIIQAWDFIGNWVKKMDEAMQECKRTIAVLSPEYINSNYTFSEWANAFIDDAKGIEDKLVTVRVTDFEPKGYLRQLVYVDFVNKTEEQAKEILLNRVKDLRRKPSLKPKFDFKGNDDLKIHKEVLIKPVFPAVKEDEEIFKKIRDIVILWRNQYSIQLTKLESFIEKLGKWREEPPHVFNEEIDDVIKTAYKIASDFKKLPLNVLDKAKHYGLLIHETVFWGQAIDTAFHMAEIYDEESREKNTKVNLMRKEQGIQTHDLIPYEYDYEMLERLIRSAIELTRFDISNLPRGFIMPTIEASATNLKEYDILFIARIDYDPRLYLISIDNQINKIQSFAARQLDLFPLCSKVNNEGTFDILAYDWAHLYVWQKSNSHPVYQFPFDKRILKATINNLDDNQWAKLISTDGRVYGITEEGDISECSSALKGKEIDNAVFWIDPLDKANWYIIASTSSDIIMSVFNGKTVISEKNKDGFFWEDPVFMSEFEKTHKTKVYWRSNSKLKISELDGLPCLLLYRHAHTGTRICFLDPTTLGFLRSPVIIDEFLDEVSIVCGRWLFIGLFQKGEIKPRLMVWDLRPSKIVFCGNWLKENGDIYTPIVVSETKNSFKVLLIHKSFNKDNMRLLLFNWPEGEVKEIAVHESISIMPVNRE